MKAAKYGVMAWAARGLRLSPRGTDGSGAVRAGQGSQPRDPVLRDCRWAAATATSPPTRCTCGRPASASRTAFGQGSPSTMRTIYADGAPAGTGRGRRAAVDLEPQRSRAPRRRPGMPTDRAGPCRHGASSGSPRCSSRWGPRAWTTPATSSAPTGWWPCRCSSCAPSTLPSVARGAGRDRSRARGGPEPHAAQAQGRAGLRSGPRRRRRDARPLRAGRAIVAPPGPGRADRPGVRPAPAGWSWPAPSTCTPTSAAASSTSPARCCRRIIAAIRWRAPRSPAPPAATPRRARFATGYRYAEMGYTACFEPADPPGERPPGPPRDGRHARWWTRAAT